MSEDRMTQSEEFQVRCAYTIMYANELTTSLAWELLEKVILQADIMELKGNPKKRAKEKHQDRDGEGLVFINKQFQHVDPPLLFDDVRMDGSVTVRFVHGNEGVSR